MDKCFTKYKNNIKESLPFLSKGFIVLVNWFSVWAQPFLFVYNITAGYPEISEWDAKPGILSEWIDPASVFYFLSITESWVSRQQGI